MSIQPTPVPHGGSFFKSNMFSILIGAISCIAWVIVFGLGMLVDSKPFRDRVASHFDPSAFFVCLIAYTPTNIFMLCLLASIAGGCASRLVVSGAKKMLEEDAAAKPITDSQIYLVENPFASMLRGMIVYFSFLAGVFVSGSNLLLEPTPQGYTQAAGVISLLSFVVGYDPTVFSNFIKVAGKMKGG
ncbi:MAG TPA: hypothetical protein VLC98_15050 [Phnomibacter sp.]|nr:hypothetical protein [Phnomibacter sp.]